MCEEKGCVDCMLREALCVCDVCGRFVCGKCVEKNNAKYNVNEKDGVKNICDYCASAYWNGF